MQILLLTPLFQPEPNHLKGLPFAEELSKLGHQVEVLTGFPNYPGGRIYPGYRQSWRFREFMNGISVCRVPLYPSHNSSGISRFITYVSLTATSVLPGLFRITRPTVVYVYLGPATLALPALVLRALFRVPFILDIQDLWPDSVMSSGMLKLPGAHKLIDLWCRLSYRYAEKIIVLSPGYKKTLIARGVDPSKIEVVYNWCTEHAPPDEEACKKIRNGFNLDGRSNIIYSGNMGPVQALKCVVDAAGILEAKGLGVRILLLGDGPELEQLKEMARASNLTSLQFIPRQSPIMASFLISCADAALVHMRGDTLGRIGIPQKTQAYLAAGRPIVMAMSGDAANLVRRARAGVICEPENPAKIARAIEKIFMLSKEARDRLGRNGREFYVDHLSFSVGVRRIVHILEECSR